jgi:hypothetical protein
MDDDDFGSVALRFESDGLRRGRPSAMTHPLRSIGSRAFSRGAGSSSQRCTRPSIVSLTTPDRSSMRACFHESLS